MAKLTLILYLMIMVPLQRCLQRKYFNYTLYRALPENDKQLKFLNDLSSVYDVSFWREPGLLHKVVEFIISPDDRFPCMQEAQILDLHLIKLMEDIQHVEHADGSTDVRQQPMLDLGYLHDSNCYWAFDEQTVKAYTRRKMDEFDWVNYFRSADIYKWLYDLANEYPQQVYLESIGKTHQNREIIAVKLTIGTTGKQRPKVIIEGGMHAREWISPAFVTYMINQLLKANTSANSALREIASVYEWHFVPLVNPDGYEISHISDRLWRKNSRGVDLNRNFDIAFGTQGVSSKKSSAVYCGEKAFSELESQAMGSYIEANSDGLDFYLAFHAYGQYMIIPYTYSKEHAENYEEVLTMCRKASLRIADRFGTGYIYGTAYDTIGYLTSGVSGCWVKKKFQVPYVVTFELRDEGRYGFALPPKDILPTCEETLDGVLSLLTPNYTRPNLKLYKTKSSSANKFMYGFVLIWNLVLFVLVRLD